MLSDKDRETLAKAEEVLEGLHMVMSRYNYKEVVCKDPGSNENLLIPADEITQAWLVLKYIKGERGVR